MKLEPIHPLVSLSLPFARTRSRANGHLPIVAVATIALLAACSSSSSTHDDADASSAADGTSGELTVVGDDGHLSIAKSALGRQRFLLAGTAFLPKWNKSDCGPQPEDFTIAPPSDTPETCSVQVAAMVTRVVVFAQDGDAVVMKEVAADGSGDGKELARFATERAASSRSSDGSSLVFAFNPNAVHVNFGLHGKSLPDDLVVPIEATVTARTSQGYAFVEQRGTGPQGLPVRVKYGIKKRQPSASFKPAFQEEGKRYFYETTDAARPIAKFDLGGSKEVVFRNVNVDPEWQRVADEGLKRGVDYWNRVFQAASGESARVFFRADVRPSEKAFIHDPGFNVVQWMKDPRNSTSNGVFQTDVATGEILFGNAYISAGFFGAGKNVGGAMFDHVAPQDVARDAAVSAFIEDYITETVSHELGHVLGLAHDFEASNVSSGKPADFDGHARAYFERAVVPPDLSTSVMEYLPIPLAGMLGRAMKTQILPHDLHAVTRGYYAKTADLEGRFGARIAAAATGAYCNDDDMTAPTCQMFDHPLCKFSPSSYCFTDQEF